MRVQSSSTRLLYPIYIGAFSISTRIGTIPFLLSRTKQPKRLPILQAKRHFAHILQNFRIHRFRPRQNRAVSCVSLCKDTGWADRVQ